MTWKDVKKDFRMNYPIYIIALPILAYYVIFNYLPMFGIIMAFQSFSPKLGYFHSPWIGLDNFKDFFGSYYFWRILRNTFLLGIFSIFFNFPMPIIFALLLNEVKANWFKKPIQTISYLPHFISTVVICGLIVNFVGTDGFIVDIVEALGGKRRNLLGQPELFRTIYIASDIWQGIGYGSIIYLAALSGIDQELYEAAVIDGAGRWKQTIHITIPGLLPTVVIMLILRCGSVFAAGGEKVLLLYNSITYETADVISSFTYRKGLVEANYGYSTAVGLFNSVINFFTLLLANAISRKYSETSLF